MENNTLCIIPCGSKKIWDKNQNAGPTKAKNVYIGPFAKKCKEYAETFYPNAWCVLSAKYGFLFPEDIVEGSYNVSFNDRNTNPISVVELEKQVEEKKMEYDSIIVLGGKNYVKIVKQVFKGKTIITPLSDCSGIGYMMEKLNNLIKGKCNTDFKIYKPPCDNKLKDSCFIEDLDKL